METSIFYQILPLPEKHLFEVHCTILHPDPAGQKISLPAWIPGSYLIRDFAKNIVTLRALVNGEEIPVEMLDKQTWRLPPLQGQVKIAYQVFAYDLVPRGAHVDTTHAFLNGSRVFLQVLGQENLAVEVELVKPHAAPYQNWQLATSLKPKQVKSDGFGRYTAENYEDLIDHPVEMGEFQALSFTACGVPHRLIVSNVADQPQADLNRLSRDLQVICEHHIKFFGLPAPMDRYVFLLNVLPKAYGGLEHRFSSANHCDRSNLPKMGEKEVSEGYRTLLTLLSHEYFHTWNVKRLKPAAFMPYDLTKENYTRQLWIFEGITSYYDELALVRTKLISKESFLELLGQSITRVFATPGRFKQSLEQSSFEAWTKFYKPDENAGNAQVSYYLKGALAALVLDLSLRPRSSLDTIMQAFWQKYGLSEQGVPEGAFEGLVSEITGRDFKDVFDSLLRGTIDPDLNGLFSNFGIVSNAYPAFSVDDIGGKKPVETLEKLSKRPLLEVRFKPGVVEAEIAFVFESSAAEAAGLSPGDVIIAVNGCKVDRARIDALLANFAIGDVVQIHAFRREKLMTFAVTLRGNWLKTYHLTLQEGCATENQKSQDAWLMGLELSGP